MPPALAATRFSPAHDCIAPLNPSWGLLHGMRVPLDFGQPADERTAPSRLGLCDVSAFPRVTIKGSDAEQTLRDLGLSVPRAILEPIELPAAGLCVRTGSAEFFIEDGRHGDAVARLTAACSASDAQVYLVPRQDVSLLLSGSLAVSELAEASSYDFGSSKAAFVFTSVAGVACSVRPRTIGNISLFQLWADGSYGVYLWEILLEMVQEAGGQAVGLAAFYDDLGSLT